MAKIKKKSPRKNTKKFLDRLKKVECPDTTHIEERFPIVMKSAKGLYVRDVDHNRYCDFTSFFGVAALGHRPQTTLQSMRKQMAQLIHGMGDVHPTESKIKLLELLAKITPFERAKSLLSLSGGDAVETAIKTAMLATKRAQFLSFAGGYHGLQFGPLSLNSNAFFTSDFNEWTKERTTSIPFPYFSGAMFCEEERPSSDFFLKKHNLQNPDAVLEILEAELKKKVYAALVMEPIQGRGGKRSFDAKFLESCKELCKKYGTLLVFDEIYTGFGRTGKMFALEHSGVVPDLLCLGKALGGGLPLSACVGDIMDVWKTSEGEARHTQTFLGHPLACAVGYKTILEIEKQLPLFQAEVPKIEQEFKNFILKMKENEFHKKVPFEIRGNGFMHGIWFYDQEEGFAVSIMNELLERGFLVLPEGPRADVLSLCPPLIAKAGEYRKFLQVAFEILKEHF
jgi:4-aminobutyrate aminotransferase-like enzyme